MKRKGFTLSEILVAMAIIGVVAAITIPMVHRVMPDKDKATVLKVFKTVNEINDELINNPTFYRLGEKVGETECQHILSCTNRPLGSRYDKDIYSGDRKYPQLLSEQLNLSSELSVSGNIYSFTTSDGVDWILLSQKNMGNSPNEYTLTIDTHNPQRDCAEVYSATCKNPRQFRFIIDNNAVVRGDDPLTRAYLLNPDDLNARSADLKKACDLSN